jgi:hypothetical protein
MFLNRFSSFSIAISVGIAVVVSSAPAFGAEAETKEQKFGLAEGDRCEPAKEAG